MKKMKNGSESLILFLIIGCILGFPTLLGLSTLFPKLWGNQNLGHGIYLTWSGKDDRYIMSYTGVCWGDITGPGKPIIPHIKNHPGEYLIKAKSNKRWIIAKGQDDSLNNHYYIIDKSFKVNLSNWEKDNCDSIIQSRIIEYSDSLLFSESLLYNKIPLHL